MHLQRNVVPANGRALVYDELNDDTFEWQPA
jgi:hypothetical protein